MQQLFIKAMFDFRWALSYWLKSFNWSLNYLVEFGIDTYIEKLNEKTMA